MSNGSFYDLDITPNSFHLTYKEMYGLFESRAELFNSLSPNNDQHLISPHNITDSSNIQVTRMNEMITKDGMS